MAGREEDPQLAKARMYLLDKLIAPLEPVLKKSKTGDAHAKGDRLRAQMRE